MTQSTSISIRERLRSEVWPFVRQPAQYIGGEINAVVKDPTAVDFRMAICYPEAYTIGMSHVGSKIIYHLVNKMEGCWAERVFSPRPDMEQRLKLKGLPLTTLESTTPLMDMDLLGFSLQYELCATHVLTMLDLSGIPLHARARKGSEPLVMGAGPMALHPEAMADFFDFFLLGDGEDAIGELIAFLREKGWHGRGGACPARTDQEGRASPAPTMNRVDLLIDLQKTFSWVYVPSLYEPHYASDGTLESVTPKEPGLPAVFRQAQVKDFSASPIPTAPVVPFVEVVHDRVTMEIMRGCPYKCNFCQATVVKNGMKVRRPEQLVAAAAESYRNTGLDEIALTSLSSGDYPWLARLTELLHKEFEGRNVNLSLPSLHIDESIGDVPSLVSSVRKAGLTFAPEAGSERLRALIDKRIKNENLFRAVRTAFEHGWRQVKLYFMIGLPTETMEDRLEIVKLGRAVSELGREAFGRPARVTCTVSIFVPKPHTPFQWEAMLDPAQVPAILDEMKAAARGSAVWLKFHEVETSQVEGLIARGDRRVSRVIEEAWRMGARFDAWREDFRPDIWQKAEEATGLGRQFFNLRERSETELLPWDPIETGVPRDKLQKRRHASYEARVIAGERKKSLASTV
ncbi:MAG: TIGR03960 family B12-binding radical SAM protein [Planctomycetota bacterium]